MITKNMMNNHTHTHPIHTLAPSQYNAMLSSGNAQTETPVAALSLSCLHMCRDRTTLTRNGMHSARYVVASRCVDCIPSHHHGRCMQLNSQHYSPSDWNYTTQQALTFHRRFSNARRPIMSSIMYHFHLSTPTSRRPMMEMTDGLSMTIIGVCRPFSVIHSHSFSSFLHTSHAPRTTNRMLHHPSSTSLTRVNHSPHVCSAIVSGESSSPSSGFISWQCNPLITC